MHVIAYIKHFFHYKLQTDDVGAGFTPVLFHLWLAELLERASRAKLNYISLLFKLVFHKRYTKLLQNTEFYQIGNS